MQAWGQQTVVYFDWLRCVHLCCETSVVASAHAHPAFPDWTADSSRGLLDKGALPESTYL